jgi:hypothetical protein
MKKPKDRKMTDESSIPAQQDDDVDELECDEACVARIVKHYDEAVRTQLWTAAHFKPVSRVIFEPNVQEAIHRLREIAKREPGDGYLRVLDQKLIELELTMNEFARLDECVDYYYDDVNTKCVHYYLQELRDMSDRMPDWQRELAWTWHGRRPKDEELVGSDEGDGR